MEVIEEVFYEDEIEEETFERYEPENIVSMTLEDKIRKYNVYVEETHEDEVIENQETIINDVEKEDIVEEVIEETIKEEPSKIILNPEIKHVKKDSIRPIEINKDRKKVVDYIISTNNKNKKESIDNQEELQVLVQDETKIKPVHEIKKTNQKKIKPIEPMKVSKK